MIGFLLFLKLAEGPGYEAEDGTLLEFKGREYQINYGYVSPDGSVRPWGVCREM